MQIGGSKALVTGASRGLGQCLAKELLARDAGRVDVATRDTPSLEPIAASDRTRVVPLVVDITDEAPVAAAADVGLVVNNAGVMAFGTPSRWI
jgi:3-oxoacyl-[acyl-carrier protein] reductase